MVYTSFGLGGIYKLWLGGIYTNSAEDLAGTEINYIGGIIHKLWLGGLYKLGERFVWRWK